jgi:hypothetical protein
MTTARAIGIFRREAGPACYRYIIVTNCHPCELKTVILNNAVDFSDMVGSIAAEG